MSWLRQLLSVNTSQQSNGTQEHPFLVGNRNHTPVKYQCVDCYQWFVEPEVDLLLRDRGDGLSTAHWLYQPLCESCAMARVNAQWGQFKAEAYKEILPMNLHDCSVRKRNRN